MVPGGVEKELFLLSRLQSLSVLWNETTVTVGGVRVPLCGGLFMTNTKAHIVASVSAINWALIRRLSLFSR